MSRFDEPGEDWGHCEGCGAKGTSTDDCRGRDAFCYSCRVRRGVPVECEFCGGTATDERNDRDGRVMSVCDTCAEDLDRSARRARDEDLRDAAADQKISEWKDEGRHRRA